MAKTEIEAQLEAVSRQFIALRLLSDGWYDGEGKAPDAVGLDSIESWLLESFPPELPAPAIVPTPEGDVLLEWDAPGEPSVDIRLCDLHASFHAFRADGTDLERTFDLQSDDERARLLAFLREAVGSGGA